MAATTREGTGLGMVGSYSTQYIEKQIDLITENVGTSSSASTVVLTNANDGSTLNSGPGLYFAHLNFSEQPTVTLPSPSTMFGRQLIFVGSFTDGETFLNITGSISGSPNSYTLVAGGIVRFFSDGSTWWAG